ncbi:transposable element Tc3 transposase [Trichonephila clavipes]|nr:transposable element Tc3 transposase [Trichonephila clavipes]
MCCNKGKIVSRTVNSFTTLDHRPYASCRGGKDSQYDDHIPYAEIGAMGLQFLFMDDNAPCHHTVAAEQLLESRRLAARTLPPVTIRELRLALQDEWAAMPQQLIDTLILSMGRRCETCLAVRGDHIPY